MPGKSYEIFKRIYCFYNDPTGTLLCFPRKEDWEDLKANKWKLFIFAFMDLPEKKDSFRDTLPAPQVGRLRVYSV